MNGDRAALAVEAAKAGAAVALETFRTEFDVEYKADKTDAVTQADRDAQRRVIEVIRERYPEDQVVGEEDDALKAVPETGPVWIIDPIDGTNNYVRGNRTFGTAVAVVIDGDPVAGTLVCPAPDIRWVGSPREDAVAGTLVCPALEDCYRVGPDGVFRNGNEISVSDRVEPEAASVVPTLWWNEDAAEICRELETQVGDMRRYGCAQAALSMVASGELEGAVSNRRPHPWDAVAGVSLVRAAGGTVTDIDGEPWRHDSTGLVASNGHLHETVLEAVQAIETVTRT